MNFESVSILIVVAFVVLSALAFVDFLAICCLNTFFDMPPIDKQPEMELTDFGWALVSETQPPRGETNLWLQVPQRHIYGWDGDGWVRYHPPETMHLPATDLPHG
jgi:hypothetical protein